MPTENGTTEKDKSSKKTGPTAEPMDIDTSITDRKKKAAEERQKKLLEKELSIKQQKVRTHRVLI